MSEENKNRNRKERERKAPRFEEDRSRISGGARLMALVMIALMILFTFVTAGIFLLD